MPGTSERTQEHGHLPVIMAIIAGVIGVAVWGMILIVLAVVVPRQEDVFRDFGVQLSAITKGVLGVSNAVRTPVGSVVGVLGILLAVSLLAWWASRGTLRWAAMLAVLLLPALGVLVMYIFGIIVPLAQLKQAI